MKPEYSGIETEGSPYKLTSTVDGGWRLTIDYPLSQTDAVMKISKKMGRNLRVIFMDPFEGFEENT